MRKIITAALAFAMLATSSVTFAGTSEARHRDRHHYSNDYGNYHGYRRHRDHSGGAAAAAIIGLTLGAIIIGSQNSRRDNYYRDDYRSRDSNWDHIRRCENRYRSYDRRSDTFVGRDGRRYYCNL